MQVLFGDMLLISKFVHVFVNVAIEPRLARCLD